MALKCAAEKFVLNLLAHLARETQEIPVRQIPEKEGREKNALGAERKAVVEEADMVEARVEVEAEEAEVAVAEAEREVAEKKEGIKISLLNCRRPFEKVASCHL